MTAVIICFPVAVRKMILSYFMAATIDHVRANLFNLGYLGGTVVSFTLQQAIGTVLEKQGFVSL